MQKPKPTALVWAFCFIKIDFPILTHWFGLSDMRIHQFPQMVSKMPLMSRLAPYLFIALFGFLAFGSTLRVGFMWDDHEMIVNNPRIQSATVDNVRYLFTHDAFDGKGDTYYRPLQLLSYVVDFKIWGLNPFGFHLTNLLLHIFNAGLLFAVMRRLFSFQIALFAGLLFSVHPINVEQALIISGRGELLATFFMFSGLACCLSSRAGARGLSVVCYIAATLSKETGLIFPLLLALVGFINPTQKIGWKLNLVFAIWACVYIFGRTVIVPPSDTILQYRDWLLFPVRDLPSILITYLRILVFPIDLHSHRRMMFSLVEQVISFLVVSGFVGWLIHRKFKLLWFASSWFVLCFIPKFPILATNALMLDHWAYLAAVPVCLLVAAGAERGIRSEKYSKHASVGLVVWLAFWMSLSLFYSSVRNTDEKMYRWALRYPSSSVVRYNLGLIEYQRGNFEESQNLFEESLRINPGVPLSANGLALSLWKQGQTEEALKILNHWIESEPAFLQSFLNRAIITWNDDGLRDLNYVLSVDPGYESAWLIKGSLLGERGDFAGAWVSLQKALEINPKNQRTLAMLRQLNVRDAAP